MKVRNWLRSWRIHRRGQWSTNPIEQRIVLKLSWVRILLYYQVFLQIPTRTQTPLMNCLCDIDLLCKFSWPIMNINYVLVIEGMLVDQLHLLTMLTDCWISHRPFSQCLTYIPERSILI